MFDRGGQAVFHRDIRENGSSESMELKPDGAVELTEVDQFGRNNVTRIDEKGIEKIRYGEDGKVTYNSRQDYDGNIYEQALQKNGKIKVSYKGANDKKAAVSEIDPAPKGTIDALLTEAKKLEGQEIWKKNSWTQKSTFEGSLGCAISVSEPLVKSGMIKQPQMTVGDLVKSLENSGWEKLPPGAPGRPGDVGIGYHHGDTQRFAGGRAHAFLVTDRDQQGRLRVMDNTNRPQGGLGPKRFQTEMEDDIPYSAIDYYRKK